MRKKLLIFIIICLMLPFTGIVHASGLYTDSGISFLSSENGVILKEIPNIGEKIYAEVTVKNDSTEEKIAVIYLCKYDGNRLKGVSFAKKSVPASGNVNLSANITVETEEDKNCTYKAYVWENAYGIGACCSEAEFLQYSTDLYGITVGGVPIENYSDDVTQYYVKISKQNEKIVLFPKSGTAKITNISYNVPGNTDITLSSGSVSKKISINTYIGEEYMCALSNLTYTVNGKEYEIENFDPNELNYDIMLPDNTFYVRVNGTSSDDISYKVQDVNGAPNRVAGVSFGKMRGDTTGPTYTYERVAINRIIPIKNEETNAIIRVTDGTNTKKYTLTFYSKQPRLTKYILTKDASTNSYVPVYTSGAGLNNDNGSVVSADRMWTASNVSKALLGAPYFMSPCNNKNANELWWGKEDRQKGDEYFRFAADTAGTVVALSTANFDMNCEEYPDEIWIRENSGTSPSGISDVRAGNKTYNDYNDPKYFFYSLNWNSNTDAIRANMGVEELSGQILTDVKNALASTSAYSYAWSRHFNAGEDVVIRHTGVQGNNAQAYVWAIVWDDIDAEEQLNSVTGDESEADLNDSSVILSYDYVNNEKNGVYNEFASVWKDLSKNSYDLTVENTVSSGWAVNGFNLVTPDDKLELAENAKKALNSCNFTVEFDLHSLQGNAAILSSDNDKFSICSEDGFVKVYIGSIARNPIALPFSEVLKGVNHIVASSNTGKTAITLKWYVDGELKADRNFIRFVFKDADMLFLGSKNADFYNGSVCLKKLKIFDKAKSQDDIRAELGD